MNFTTVFGSNLSVHTNIPVGRHGQFEAQHSFPSNHVFVFSFQHYSVGSFLDCLFGLPLSSRYQADGVQVDQNHHSVRNLLHMNKPEKLRKSSSPRGIMYHRPRVQSALSASKTIQPPYCLATELLLSFSVLCSSIRVRVQEFLVIMC